MAEQAAGCGYPLVFFDAIRVKIRDEGFVRNKAIYIALGILPDGTKEILGIWIEQTEGAKFWLRVMNELKNRGVADILIAVVDGLKGFPEAISAVFPQTVVQTCIVHLIRHSLEFVSWKDRKAVVPALRAIYRAKDAEAGMKALEDFEAGFWGQRYPAITQSWRRNWEHVVPFFAYPESVPESTAGGKPTGPAARSGAGSGCGRSQTMEAIPRSASEWLLHPIAPSGARLDFFHGDQHAVAQP